MCKNSISGKQSDQIRKFVEHGMPEKIVKTVQYTLRKRAAEQKPTEASMENFGHHGETRNSNNAANATASAAAAADHIVHNASNQQHSTNKVETFNIPRLCGRFRKTQANSEVMQDKITNISATGTEENTDKKMQHPSNIDQMDAIAITTQITKVYVQRLYGVAVKMQSSKLYKLLTRTTQPAHLIAVAVLTFVLFTVWPDIIDTRNTSATIKNNNGEQRPQRLNTLAAIAYLGAFATHFGAQIWMTFVSGLSLYFSLPRHTFGQCQQILFPRYFALSSILSISMLILFVKYFLHSWNAAAMVQLISLGSTAIIEVIIRLYLAPPMLRLMHEKYRIEGAIGSGREVGTLEQGDLIQCPHYQRIHKTFRRIHMTIAMGNMAVLLATCLHLYFLASKIQIS